MESKIIFWVTTMRFSTAVREEMQKSKQKKTVEPLWVFEVLRLKPSMCPSYSTKVSNSKRMNESMPFKESRNLHNNE